MAALLDGVTFGRQFGQKGAERGGCDGWVAEFSAKVEVQPGPLMVFRMSGSWHACSIKASFETDVQFRGQLRHGHWKKPLRYASSRRVFPAVIQRVGKVNRKALKTLYRRSAKDEGGFSEREIATVGRGFVYLSPQMAG